MRDCSAAERAAFNMNLIKQLNEEYVRAPLDHSSTPSYLHVSTPSIGNNLIDDTDKRVVEWKFTELDKEKDDELKRKEIRDFRYIVNKMLKPRACAQSFHTFCDMDNNRKISRQEWSTCLGVSSASKYILLVIVVDGLMFTL